MDTTTPRITPLPPEERDERTENLLRTLRRDPAGPDLNIFATLARHPRLLKRWSDFGGTLLYRGELSPRDRELLILRTAWNCDTDYEWGQHVLIGAEAGLTEEEIAGCAGPLAATDWSNGDRDLLRAADELHAEARIGDATWEALAARFSDAQLLELCMVVGQYHLVAFVLNSAGVQPEPGIGGLPR